MIATALKRLVQITATCLATGFITWAIAMLSSDPRGLFASDPNALAGPSPTMTSAQSIGPRSVGAAITSPTVRVPRTAKTVKARIDENDHSLSPYFVVLGGDPSVDALPLKSTEVEARIVGVIADVTVTQTYANEGSRPIEARYLFPGSTRAAVHTMEVRLGERRIVAEIREKQRARQDYEAARAQGKTAALLEQHRTNVFEMNVANILAGDMVRVQLRYTELLSAEAGTYQFVFPNVVGPRYVNDEQIESGESATQALTAQATLPAGEDTPSLFTMRVAIDSPIVLAEISSSSHEIDVNRAGATHATVSLPTYTASAPNDRDFILDFRLAGDAITSGVFLARGDSEEDENFFLAMVEPPKVVTPELITPRDYLFVLDVSGSMHGFPLDTAKELMRALFDNLRPSDSFNVLLFSGSSEMLHEHSVPATPENLKKSFALIDCTQRGGGTELLPALRRVYAQPKPDDVSRTIVILTDGFVSVEREAFSLVRQNLGLANLFAFGIGSSVNRALIEGLARAGRGEPFVVTRPEETKDAVARFRQMIDAPVLTNVTARFEGIETYDVVPHVLPDLFTERPIVLFGKWREQGDLGNGKARLVISGHQTSGLYANEITLSETADAESTNLTALRHLWARQQIAELSDQEALEGSNERLKRAITELGLRYSLLTNYTSFIAVDEVARNLRPDKTVSVAQPQPLPRGVSSERISLHGNYVPSTPEPEVWAALVLTLTMVAIIARRSVS